MDATKTWNGRCHKLVALEPSVKELRYGKLAASVHDTAKQRWQGTPVKTSESICFVNLSYSSGKSALSTEVFFLSLHLCFDCVSGVAHDDICGAVKETCGQSVGCFLLPSCALLVVGHF